jgi:NAD(P)H-hydrate epimerase
VIDGLFGTGLARTVKGDFKLAIEALNRARIRHSDLKVLAVDIPSGLNADSGRPMGAAVAADVTVTFGLPKVGLIQQSAVDLVGRLAVADIGFSPSRIAAIKTRLEYWTEAEARRLVRPRKMGAFKNDYGHALIVAGSVGLHGAAWITAHGALAAGAGLVTLAVPRSIYEVVAAQCRQVMVAPLEDDGRGFLTPGAWDDLQPLLAKKTAVAIGPGIGRAPPTLEFLTKFMPALRAAAVLDADALTLAAGRPKILRAARGPLVCTPHPGEMARLLGSTSQKVQANRLEIAARFARNARKQNVVIALKGARTVVADPAGLLSVNSSGNPALASGGTGDVLTGVIAGLLAQGMPAADAARLGVFIHGRAADRLAEGPVTVGLKVEDLLREVPRVLSSMVKSRD